jgi:hypothetical protein
MGNQFGVLAVFTGKAGGDIHDLTQKRVAL